VDFERGKNVESISMVNATRLVFLPDRLNVNPWNEITLLQVRQIFAHDTAQ
jgi:hypothetical protein